MPHALAAAYDVLLLDLDGVVYIGPDPIPGAPEALQRAKRAGIHLAYVTNNASRTPAAVAASLEAMGAPAAPADVITSSQAAARLLADKLPPKARVLVIGSAALRIAVRERGLVPVSTAADNPQAVVQGYAPGLAYGSFAEGGLAVRSGALFVATNSDSTLPSPRGIQPGNGSLLRVIAHATGTEPVVAGKPEPPLHRESVIRTGAQHPLVVGDRLDTDIEAAYNTGTDSLLVLTGVDGPHAVVLAPRQHRPTYIASSLDALLEPYPEVTVHPAAAGTPATATCQGWTATVAAAGEITLAVPASATVAGPPASSGSDTGPAASTGPAAAQAINGLRALAAAVWASPQPPPVAEVTAALARLAAAGLPVR